jgi:hypothetical protein
MWQKYWNLKRINTVVLIANYVSNGTGLKNRYKYIIHVGCG